MTRRERHLIYEGDIPRTDDMPARIGIAFDLFDELTHLVGRFTVFALP